jgi:lipid A ethanolaminephosphotransferase
MIKLKNQLTITHFALIMSLLNFLLFHFPFYAFVFENVDYKSLNGIVLIASLIILMLLVNSLVFYLVFFLSRFVGKFLLVLFFIINAIAVYFINTYSVIIDESMIGLFNCLL